MAHSMGPIQWGPFYAPLFRTVYVPPKGLKKAPHGFHNEYHIQSMPKIVLLEARFVRINYISL